MQKHYGDGCDGGLAPQQHSLTVAGIGWQYLQWGDNGPPLVLWHGVTSDARAWWRVGPTLAALGFCVYAPDLPGHGQTGASPDGYAAAVTARVLDAWMAGLGIEQPIIVGHSWGGLNALVHATLPDPHVQARALILEDPALKLSSQPQQYLHAFTAGIGVPPNEQSLAEIQTLNPRWHPCDVWWKAQARERVHQAAVEHFFLDNTGIDVVGQLNQLQVPTLLLLADPSFGGIWSRQHVDIVQQTSSPNVQLTVIEGSSHNIHRDSFEPFMTTIKQFL